ncbi:sulfite exporter TauE/SafE family protein [Engelhardtia mirabilis]|uniref:Probable membrane transporter protein n=1 Tax=Engelhardtia mirabilis TaxID=2528011 RepID=A0A518BG42_9BACT|nr:Sulfite exporter TauE/SafE [Planctomycetes bacterium Pla133]QDV00280.1 Sulfite exporter TauE/SafE [Planctomycetes bacterium Pla86]
MSESPPPPSARRWILGTALVVWTAWLIGMVAGDHWGLFREGWFMSITMAFGSFVAGATSEGGGAVAFPVMTLGFQIAPPVARDFSLMIQSVGMSSAALTILGSRIPVEHRSLIWSSLGGAIGMIVGLEFVAPRLSPTFAKLTFLAVWLAFAFALFWINRYREREVRLDIEHFGARHATLLLGAGLIGGTISAITGSGLDILTFSLLVLRFRISEKIATPTSVILMAINACVGFAWKASAGGGMAAEAWSYWWVCVPIVVVGAPFGASFIRDRSRLFVASILYVAIGVQFIAGLVIIEQTPQVVAFTAAVFAAALLMFRSMARGGVRRLDWLTTVREDGAGQ